MADQQTLVSPTDKTDSPNGTTTTQDREKDTETATDDQQTQANTPSHEETTATITTETTTTTTTTTTPKTQDTTVSHTTPAAQTTTSTPATAIPNPSTPVKGATASSTTQSSTPASSSSATSSSASASKGSAKKSNAADHSPASTSTSTTALTPNTGISSSSFSATSSSPANLSPQKKENSGNSISSMKSAEKEKTATKKETESASSSSSSSSPPAPTPAKGGSGESGVDWTSVMTFGLASSKAKTDVTEWLPDKSEKVTSSLFSQPALNEEGSPASLFLNNSPNPSIFPNFTSVLYPIPPPSSALRFGWIDEYGDYHPQPSSLTSSASGAAKINPKIVKAKESARELISAILTAQEKAEKDKEPTSPRLSTVVKDRLSAEAGKASSSIGVDRLVQVVEGKKGEKKVVIKEEEKADEEM